MSLLVRHEEAVKAALRHTNSDITEDRVDTLYNVLLEREQGLLRNMLEGAEKANQQKRAQEARSNFRSISDPSQWGTVAEIAQ